MHLWLNGPFGVGKTSVARAVVRLRPGARLIDPEPIGLRVRRDLGEPVEDFRDLSAWRAETSRALASAAREGAGLLVVPMTVDDPDHLAEILEPLSAEGVAFRCVTLMASAETIRRRIRRRLDWPRSKRWALARVEPSLAALAAPWFAPQVSTEARSVREVAEDVLAMLEG